MLVTRNPLRHVVWLLVAVLILSTVPAAHAQSKELKGELNVFLQTYYNPADYPSATEQQRRMMAPPSVGSRPNTVG